MAGAGNLRRQRWRTREMGRGIAGRLAVLIAAIVFYPVSFLLSRWRVTGLERIPAEGPAILVLNHVSHLDPVYDAVLVHRAGRLPRFLAKNTLWNVPVFGRIMRGVEQIPVYRGTSDARKSLEAAHRALTENKTILIYPDGTITRDPQGWPMTPKVGVSRLALEHSVPVIPIARWGTREIYDGYNKKFRPFPRKEVTIKVGEPIDLGAYRGRPPENQVLREVAELAMSRVRDLLADIRDEPPPEKFYSMARARSDGGDA